MSPTVAAADVPNLGDTAPSSDDPRTGSAAPPMVTNDRNSDASAPASDPGQAARAALLRQFMASSFVTDGDGNGTTPIAVPLSGDQPLLAQPHA